MIKSRVLSKGLQFPEGPAFAPDGSLWGVELTGGSLFRWTPQRLERIEVEGRPNGLTFRGKTAIFCDAGQDCVRHLDIGAPSTTGIVAIGEDRTRLTAPNDLAFSPDGTLVFTCPGNSRFEPTGTVWRQSLSGDLRCIASDLRFPNGLAFTPDGCELIVAETFLQRLWRGRWDEVAGAWVDASPWVDVGGPIGPDGMAYGPDGRLYVALYGQGCVLAIDQDGTVLERIAVAGSRPTNVAFDPSGDLGMIVTEAENGLLLSYPGVGNA